jgi:magnesium chelatase family protein
LERFASDRIFCNAQMSPRLISKYCVIDSASKSLLENAITRLGLSARAYDRILKVSHTLADLEGKDSIKPCHVSEAIQYRTLDRNFWA